MVKAEKLEETAEKLREQILRGDYGIRGSLPSRTSLEEEFDVSHSVMNQVILQLQGEGIISTGGGTKRLLATPPGKRVPINNKAFSQILVEQGFEPKIEYIEHSERNPMNSALAKLFGVPEGTLFVARSRREGTKQIHYSITRNFFISDLIDDQTLIKMQEQEKYDVIKEIGQKKGISATFHKKDIVIARLPSANEQELLRIVRSSPVLEITRTYYDYEGGRVIWLKQSILVASLFVIHQDIEDESFW